MDPFRLKTVCRCSPIWWACLAILCGGLSAEFFDSFLNLYALFLTTITIVCAISLWFLKYKFCRQQNSSYASFVHKHERWKKRLWQGFGFGLLVWFSFFWYKLWDRESEFQRIDLPRPSVVKVCGRVANIAVIPSKNRFSGKQEPRTRLILRLRSVIHRNHVRELDGVLVCNGKGDIKDDVLVGQLIETTVIRKDLQGVRNPGGFDYGHWLRSRGFAGSCHILDIHKIKVVGEPRIWNFPDQLRFRFRRVLEERLNKKNRGLAISVILGDRSYLTGENKDKYIETGTVHLLAISGLHLGIVTCFFLSLSRIPFLPKEVVFGLTFLFIWFFAWLVGFRPPILRAAILLSIWMIGKLRKKQSFTFHSLALAFLCVFAVSPMSIFEPGTHLSFLAVATILWLSKQFPGPQLDPLESLKLEKRNVLVRLIYYSWKRIKSIYRLSFFVFIVGLPFVFHTFHICGWIGILVNPILVLPMSSALFSGFFLLICDLTNCPGSSLCVFVCDQSLLCVQTLVDWSHQVSAGRHWGPSPGWIWVAIFYLVWCPYLMISPTQKRQFFRWLDPFIIGFTILLAVISYLIPIPKRPLLGSDPKTEAVMAMIDVGHGQCLLFQTKDSKTLLYDCGSLYSDRQAASVITNFLFSNGIRKLDVVVISHNDSDHYNALEIISSRIPIDQLWVSSQAKNSFKNPNHPIRSVVRRVQLKAFQLPGKIFWSKDWSISVLSPPAAGFSDGDNSNSLVLSITGISGSILLTGDLEGRGLSKLQSQLPEAFTVLQVPHHGSKNSHPESFSKWVSPKVAMISQGRTSFNPSVVECYENVGSKVMSTAKEGAVLVRIRKDSSIETRTWRHNRWAVR